LSTKTISYMKNRTWESVTNAHNECQRFDNVRHILLNTISNFIAPSLEVILFGMESKSFEAYEIICSAVHKYIKLSKMIET
jgi:hypothetical protein